MDTVRSVKWHGRSTPSYFMALSSKSLSDFLEVKGCRGKHKLRDENIRPCAYLHRTSAHGSSSSLYAAAGSELQEKSVQELDKNYAESSTTDKAAVFSQQSDSILAPDNSMLGAQARAAELAAASAAKQRQANRELEDGQLPTKSAISLSSFTKIQPLTSRNKGSKSWKPLALDVLDPSQDGSTQRFAGRVSGGPGAVDVETQSQEHSSGSGAVKLHGAQSRSSKSPVEDESLTNSRNVPRLFPHCHAPGIPSDLQEPGMSKIMHDEESDPRKRSVSMTDEFCLSKSTAETPVETLGDPSGHAAWQKDLDWCRMPEELCNNGAVYQLDHLRLADMDACRNHSKSIISDLKCPFQGQASAELKSEPAGVSMASSTLLEEVDVPTGRFTWASHGQKHRATSALDECSVPSNEQIAALCKVKLNLDGKRLVEKYGPNTDSDAKLNSESGNVSPQRYGLQPCASSNDRHNRVFVDEANIRSGKGQSVFESFDLAHVMHGPQHLNNAARDAPPLLQADGNLFALAPITSDERNRVRRCMIKAGHAVSNNNAGPQVLPRIRLGNLDESQSWFYNDPRGERALREQVSLAAEAHASNISSRIRAKNGGSLPSGFREGRDDGAAATLILGNISCNLQTYLMGDRNSTEQRRNFHKVKSVPSWCTEMASPSLGRQRVGDSFFDESSGGFHGAPVRVARDPRFRPQTREEVKTKPEEEWKHRHEMYGRRII